MSDPAPKRKRSQRVKAEPEGAAKPRASRKNPHDSVGSSPTRRPATPADTSDENQVPNPEDFSVMLEEMQARVQSDPNASWEERKRWAEEFHNRFGARWGSVALSCINKICVAHSTPGVVVNSNNAVAVGIEAMATANQGRNAITQAAMRDQIAATAGNNNMVEAGDIRVFNEWLGVQGATPDAEQSGVLLACYRELRTACIDESEAEILLSHFRTLATEVLKDAKSRKESIVRMSRAAIHAALNSGRQFPAWDSLASLFKL